MFRLLFAIGLFFSSNTGLAQAILDYSIHQTFITPRSLAAGSTFSGIDDYNTLFYNPAGLARLKEGQLNMGLQFAGTPSIISMAKDIDTASKDASPNIAMVNLINNHSGDHYSLRFPSTEAIWARPGWGIGIIPIDPTINVEFHQQLGPELNVVANQDSTVAFGYAKNYLENDALSVGADLKAIYRAFYGKDLLAVDLVNSPELFKPSDAQEGMTFDIDLGAIYTLKAPEEGFLKFLKYAEPTFALVVRNLLDFGFKQNMHLYNKNSAGEPPKLQRRVDVGSKWDLPSFWVFRPRGMLDVRDIGHQNWTFLKGLHIGGELLWDAFSWLRGGYSVGLSQGYLSAGISAQLIWFRLDLATYGEEMGTSNAKKENRNYVAKFSLDF